MGILNLPQSPDIGENSDRISDFRISRESLIKGNCHNSRTRDDIDMKLEPLTKLDKKNKTMSKKLDDYVMSKNCDVIAIFSIYSQFGAIRKPDSGRIFCKISVFINSNIYLIKTENRTKKNFNKTLRLLLWVKVLFRPKNADFLWKMLASAKLRRR